MNRGLKMVSLTVLYLALASGAFAQTAQNPDPSKWMCRNLADTGGFVYQGETVFGSQACRPIPQASVQHPQTNPAPSQPERVVPAQGPTQTSVPEATPSPVNTKIAPGSTVYVTPMDGFENYLAAAFEKKKVPLVTVANEAQAAYVIKGTSEEKKAGWAKMVFTGQIHSDDAASIQMVDRRSGAIVFAYAVNKKNTMHGHQTTAEACAKHLKERIEKK